MTIATRLFSSAATRPVEEKRFYRDAVPKAERRYAEHLRSNGKEPPWQRRNPLNRPTPNQCALDKARIAVYARLLEAEDVIAQDRYAHGVSDETVQAALDACDEGPSDAERREDLYFSALHHYVRALGGRLEIRAVFGADVVDITPDAAS